MRFRKISNPKSAVSNLYFTFVQNFQLWKNFSAKQLFTELGQFYQGLSYSFLIRYTSNSLIQTSLPSLPTCTPLFLSSTSFSPSALKRRSSGFLLKKKTKIKLSIPHFGSCSVCRESFLSPPYYLHNPLPTLSIMEKHRNLSAGLRGLPFWIPFVSFRLRGWDSIINPSNTRQSEWCSRWYKQYWYWHFFCGFLSKFRKNWAWNRKFHLPSGAISWEVYQE